MHKTGNNSSLKGEALSLMSDLRSEISCLNLNDRNQLSCFLIKYIPLQLVPSRSLLQHLSHQLECKAGILEKQCLSILGSPPPNSPLKIYKYLFLWGCSKQMLNEFRVATSQAEWVIPAHTTRLWRYVAYRIRRSRDYLRFCKDALQNTEIIFLFKQQRESRCRMMTQILYLFITYE